MQVDQHRSDLRQFDLEAVPVGLVEAPLQLLQRHIRAGQRDGQHVGLALELHVGEVQKVDPLDGDALAVDGAPAFVDLSRQDGLRFRDVQLG